MDFNTQLAVPYYLLITYVPLTRVWVSYKGMCLHLKPNIAHTLGCRDFVLKYDMGLWTIF